jgi:hypothetical protein
MSSLPKCQTHDPLGNAYMFDDCIVLSKIDEEWGNTLRSIGGSVKNDVQHVSKRLIYFHPDKGLWECSIHLNIACIIPVTIGVQNYATQIETIIQYLVLTAKKATPNYSLANLVTYRLYFYFPKDLTPAIKGSRQTEGTVSRTRLGSSVEQYREYKLILDFDDKWNLVREAPVPKTEPSSTSHSRLFTFEPQSTKTNSEGVLPRSISAPVPHNQYDWTKTTDLFSPKRAGFFPDDTPGKKETSQRPESQVFSGSSLFQPSQGFIFGTNSVDTSKQTVFSPQFTFTPQPHAGRGFNFGTS